MVAIEPLLDVCMHFRVANGVAQALPNQPLRLFVNNFSKEPSCLPNNMDVETASRSPLKIREVLAKMGREFARFPHVGEYGIENCEVTGKIKDQKIEKTGGIPKNHKYYGARVWPLKPS